MKTLDTLVDDMYHVLDTGEGWSSSVQDTVEGMIHETLTRRFQEDDQPSDTLRMSNLGTPCHRKLWYTLSSDVESENLPAPTKFKFLYGDMLEAITIGLAMAAGHSVTGLQTTLDIGGIKGHRDCVIDGVTVDVKSASSYSFNKFQEGLVPSTDSFGYLGQLKSYVYAARDDISVDSNKGAFLAIDKTLGKICLDVHDFTGHIDHWGEVVQSIKEVATGDDLPPRHFDPVPDGKSGNRKLGVNCSYCHFKHDCWPRIRTFLYSNGPRYLTHTVREPNVMEVKNG